MPKTEPLIVDPRVSARVEATYAETLERVYHHADGNMIMLSVAYGERQLDDSLQAHRPEYCYRAQGFTIDDSHDTAVQTVTGALPVRRLLTRRGQRVEPITYWLTIGQRAVLPGLGRQLAQLSYGLRGEIPDGLLIRISSLNATPDLAWPVHERFISDLFQTLPSAHLRRIAGDWPQADRAQQF
jgi:EpsI family protein